MPLFENPLLICLYCCLLIAETMTFWFYSTAECCQEAVRSRYFHLSVLCIALLASVLYLYPYYSTGTVSLTICSSGLLSLYLNSCMTCGQLGLSSQDLMTLVVPSACAELGRMTFTDSTLSTQNSLQQFIQLDSPLELQTFFSSLKDLERSATGFFPQYH